MAGLGNILKRGGGVALTGRAVKFHIVTEDADGNRNQHQVAAVMLPVTEEDRLAAHAEARAFCEEQKSPHAYQVETDLRFLQKALRDPENLKVQFVMANEVHLLRRGLVMEQLQFLSREYDSLLKDQYPECFTVEDFKKTVAEAKVFSKGGQVEPGPSSP